MYKIETAILRDKYTFRTINMIEKKDLYKYLNCLLDYNVNPLVISNTSNIPYLDQHMIAHFVSLFRYDREIIALPTCQEHP